jgi:hypothetical protein
LRPRPPAQTMRTAGDGVTARGFTKADLAALGTVAAVWILLIGFSKRPLTLTIVDDAYIYLRVIENWLSGAGWTYNTGDLTVSFNPLTSPLYALFVALVRAVTGPGPVTLLATYAVGLAAFVCVHYLGLRDNGRLFAMVTAIATSSGYVLRHSVGMETSVYLALILATALAYQRGRYWAAGLLSGLVALVRPEGVALVGVIGLLHLVARRRILWPLIVGSAIVVLPWVLISWSAFGGVLPHTVRLKAVQSGIGVWREQGSWLTAFLSQPVAPLVTYTIAGVGAVWAWKEFRQGKSYVLIIAGFGMVQVAGFSLLRAPVGYFWYFAPGNLAVDTLLVAGLFVSARGLGRWWQRRRSREPALSSNGRVSGTWRRARAAVVCLLAVLAASQGGAAEWTEGIKPYCLASDYRDVGLWISENSPPEVRVAAAEIGYLGYYSNRRIRDIHGLIHPEALESVAQERWDWWFTSDPPEIVVIHVPPWHGEPSREWWPEESLREFERRYAEIYGGPRLEVYGLRTLFWRE